VDARFGELRSLAAGVPSPQAWDALCAACAPVASREPARWAEQLVPYLDRALARWPDALRVCSRDDTRSLMDGLPPGPLSSIARALNTPSAGRAVSPTILSTTSAITPTSRGSATCASRSRLRSPGPCGPGSSDRHTSAA
jgi:hypothetical protein